MQNAGKKEILDAELWAIDDPLELALKEKSSNHDTPLTVFNDSREVLAAIGRQFPKKVIPI